MEPAQEKGEVRRAHRQRRGQMPPEEQLRLSTAVCQRLQGLLGRWRTFCGDYYGNILAAYMSYQGEVDLWPLLQSERARGRQVLLPRVSCQTGGLEQRLHMDFAPLEGGRESLARGALGILEPLGEAVTLAAVGVFLVPALGFDLKGHRVGSGRGYYDRALWPVVARRAPFPVAGGADFGPLLVGVGYDWQVLGGTLESAGHDVPMDVLVTESAAYACAPWSGILTE